MIKRFWLWLTKPFRKKKKPPARAATFHPGGSMHHRDSDVVDGMVTYMVMDSIGDAGAALVKPIVESTTSPAVVHEHIPDVIAPSGGNTTRFNDYGSTTSFGGGSSKVSTPDDDSMLTKAFADIGDAVGSVFSD